MHFSQFNYQQYHEVHKSFIKCYMYLVHFKCNVYSTPDSEEIINDAYHRFIHNVKDCDNDFIRDIRFEIYNHKIFRNILLCFIRYQTIRECILIDKFYNII